jgi:ribose transport system substrate-binding protein
MSRGPGFTASGVVAAVAMLALAACGGSSSTSSTSAAGQTASAGQNATCVTAATAAADKAKAAHPPEFPKTPIDMSANKGKSVWWIGSIEVDFLKGIGDGFAVAAKRAGMKPSVHYATGTAASFNDLVGTAVAQHADAIILYSIDPGLVAAPLKKAKDAGIVIIDAFVGRPTDPVPAGIYTHMTADFALLGQELSNWALADSKCDLRTIVFGATVIPIHVQFMDGAKKTINTACPSCKVSLENIDLSAMATALGPQVNTLLTREGDINYAFPVLDAAVPFIEPALAQHSDVKVISHDGVGAQLDEIRKGGKLVADGAFPPGAYMGWVLADQIGRGLQKMKPYPWVIPDRVVDRTNVGKTNADIWSGWTDAAFDAGFTKAWGM